MEHVTFNEFYALMNIAGIIIVEDSIEFDMSRKAIMYNCLMLKDDEKENLLRNISDKQIIYKLKSIFEAYSKCKDGFKWDSVPKRDVEHYIKGSGFDELKNAIENLTEDDIKENSELFQRFGLGLKSENAKGYKNLLEGTIKDGVSLPLRIYTDFSAPDLKCMEEDWELFSRNGKFFLCVIDNFMNGEARGKDVIDELYANDQARKNGICIVLSSQQEDITRKTDEMYVGFC